MSGNRIGGLKTAAINKQKDPNFYKRIGVPAPLVSSEALTLRLEAERSYE